jgi:ferric-dicitrate binding protein FerR (iron transport regulator)
MTAPMDDERAVRAMIGALREEPAPELDWDAMEQRLSARLDQDERASRSIAVRRPRSPLWMGMPLVAAAAAIVLGLSSAGSRAPSPAAGVTRAVDPSSIALASGEAGMRGEHDLAALRAGDVIEAGATPVTFGRAGSLRWTLAPGSRVVVKVPAGEPASTDAAGGHVVALERGSLRAEVVPRDPALGLLEAFAVEVDRTRVAVHGTAFTVTRSEGGLVVDVEHGAVAVGPVGHVGTTSGHLLVGPSRASFSLDGGRTARMLPREDAAVAALGTGEPQVDGVPAPAARALDDVATRAAAGAASRAQRPSATPLAAAPASPEVAAAHPAEPSTAAPASPEVAAAQPVQRPTLTVDGVRAGLQRCFAAAYEGSASVGLSVSSTLTIVVRDDGTVGSPAPRFNPPMEPEFTACAAGVIYGGRFAEAGRTLSIPLTFGR